MTTELAIPSSTTVVTVTDREGDIYELFALEREANSELLIRAKHNRRIAHEIKLLKETIAQTPSSGQLVISVPRKDEQPTREATLTVSYASLTFLPPSNRPKTAPRQKITLNRPLA